MKFFSNLHKYSRPHIFMFGLVLMFGIAQPAHALFGYPKVTAFAAMETGAVGGLIFGNIPGAIVGAIGGFATGYVCILVDPPDTINYAVRAKPDLITYTLPSDSQWSQSLQNLAQSTVNASSQFIQSYKAIQQSTDRLSGAITVGGEASVEALNQKQWLSESITLAKSNADQVIQSTNSFISLLANEQPSLANFTFTPSDIKQMRDEAKDGKISQETQNLITHYQLDPSIYQNINAQFASLTDSQIDNIGSFTYAQALAGNAQGCSTCIPPVPEPEEWTMILLGFGLVGYQVRRKREKVNSAGRI